MSTENPKVAQFVPRGLEEPKEKSRMEIRTFTPSQLRPNVVNDYGTVKKTFGSLAATDPDTSSRFNLHPDSKRLLGVEKEERSHLETIITQEVTTRLEALSEQAHAEGYNAGLEKGKEEARAAMEAKMKPVWDQFIALLSAFENIKQEMYAENERVLINLIFNIAKQVTLKELKTDRDYVKRLSVQLIEKIGIKEHLKIKVNKADFENTETLKEFFKTQVEGLKNLQIEVSDEVQLGGCKVETNLIRINATLEAQFKAIEEAFKET